MSVVVKDFTIAPLNGGCRDMTFGGEHLWVVDILDALLYKWSVDGILVDTIAITANPRGLTFDGKHLIYADSGTGLVYFLDPDTGIVRRTVNIAPFTGFPDGMTFDGKHLWIVRTTALFQVSIDGTLRRTVILDAAFKNGLTFDGEHIWYSDSTNNLIVQIDLDGVIRRSFASPGANIEMGLAFDGKHLWHSDQGTDRVYQIKI